jgi:hypothetical protein
MRKRWVLILLALTAFGLSALWLYQTRIVVGWMRDEAFYQGRPSSYWAAEIRLWECTKKPWIRHCMGHKEYHRRPFLPDVLARFVPVPEPIWPSLFDGDTAGLDVLTELAEDPSETVSEWANEGIDRITTGEKGPNMAVHILFGRIGKQLPTILNPPHLTADQVHGGIGP